MSFNHEAEFPVKIRIHEGTPVFVSREIAIKRQFTNVWEKIVCSIFNIIDKSIDDELVGQHVPRRVVVEADHLFWLHAAVV
jgi:hypothetical protein